MNEMPTKKTPTFEKKFKKSIRNLGYTLLETLVATGIAAVVITSAISVTGNVYRSQRKVQFAQDFYSESRFMMERISQIARNNTLDYDRYFLEIGPITTNCASFNTDQIPYKYKDGADGDDLINENNSPSNRYTLGYETLFYWDTDSNEKQDRNLGGVNPTGVADPCLKAWEKNNFIQNLFLINGNRTMRTSLRRNPSSIQLFDNDQNGTPETNNPNYDTTDPDFNKLEMQRQLGADLNGDGKSDIWAPDTASDVTIDLDLNGTFETGKPLIHWDGSQCLLYIDENNNSSLDGSELSHIILGDRTSEDFCKKSHDFTDISPNALEITELSFLLSPNRDPYLNFRIDSAQIHPQVFISMTAKVRNPKSYDFGTQENAPNISFQTMVSSRVFGNPRK